MRGFLAFIMIAAVVVLVGAILWTRIPDIVAKRLSSKLGVPVSIESFSASSSKLEFGSLTIMNPKGYSLPKAFAAETTKIQAPITTYFKSNVVVEEVAIDNIYLGLEFDSPSSKSGNWSVILKHLAKEGKLSKDDGKKVLIKRLICTNIHTELLFRGQGGSVKQLPKIDRIELTNISTEGGFPTDQLMASVLGQMLKQVFLQQNLNNMLKDIFESPEGAVDSVLKPLKGFFNAAPQASDQETLSA